MSELITSAFNNRVFFFFCSSLQPRTVEFNLKSPGTKPVFMLNRISMSGQTSLRRGTSSTSIGEGPADYNLPRTPLPLSPRSVSQMSDSSTFTDAPPESPVATYESDPDYENIENFPEKEPEVSFTGLPPNLPPRRPKKPRSISLNEEHQSGPQQIRRIRSEKQFASLSELPELDFDEFQKAPIIPPKTPTAIKSLSSSAFDDDNEEEAPPLPPRQPTAGSHRGRPPIPPRMSPSSPMRPPMPLPNFSLEPEEAAIQQNNVPPKLPPKTRRS